MLRIYECIDHNKNHINDLHSYTAGGFFLPDLHTELVNLGRQLSDCLNLWSSYFTLTQTRFYRIFRNATYSRTELKESDLLKHEQYLIELHHTINRLQNQHQTSVNRILEHYLDRLSQGDSPSQFVPYAENDKIDVVFIGISAMHYSTIKLAQAALALGTNIHTIFELETTSLYQPF